LDSEHLITLDFSDNNTQYVDASTEAGFPLVITQVSAHFSEKATIMRQRAIVEVHAMSTHANTLYVTKSGNPEFDLEYRSPEMS
jgi:hypothetical protein